MLTHIRTKTLCLMNEKGMNFTISELANQLAISKRTVYDHYDSKSSLINDVLNEILFDLQHQVENIVELQDLSDIDKIKALMTTSPKALGPLSARIIEDVKIRLPELWNNFEYFFDERWQKIKYLIESGVEQGTFRKVDMDVLQQIYRGSINEINEYHFLTQNNQTFQNAIAKAADIIINGVIALDNRQPPS